MTSLAHSPTNDHRLEDLIKEVRAFGREAAEGKDSLPKLAIRVVRAANEKIISPEVHKDGTDDAKKLYTEYAQAESKKLIHEHTKDGLKANVSKLRALIKFGAMETCDPVVVVETAATIRHGMAEAGQKVKSAYAAYVDVARKQLDSDTQLDDEQIKEAMLKPEGEEPTVEKRLTAVLKTLDQLITGEKGLVDQSEEVANAHGLIKRRLAALMTARETAEVMAKAAELGIAILPAPEPKSTAGLEAYLPAEAAEAQAIAPDVAAAA